MKKILAILMVLMFLCSMVVVSAADIVNREKIGVISNGDEIWIEEYDDGTVKVGTVTPWYSWIFQLAKIDVGTEYTSITLGLNHPDPILYPSSETYDGYRYDLLSGQVTFVDGRPVYDFHLRITNTNTGQIVHEQITHWALVDGGCPDTPSYFEEHKLWVVSGGGNTLGEFTLGFRIYFPYTPIEKYQVSNFQITPENPIAGDTIVGTVDVSNVGELDGQYEVELRINGNLWDSRTVTLSVGQTKTISFEILTTQGDEGTYVININGLEKSVVILQVATPTPTATASPTPTTSPTVTASPSPSPSPNGDDVSFFQWLSDAIMNLINSVLGWLRL